MKAIPCRQNQDLQKQIEAYAVALKAQAHSIGDHGLDEQEFYASGLFRGAIEKIRGEFSATMIDKRSFVKAVLDYLQDLGAIAEWHSSGEKNRHDYTVLHSSGKTTAIELKGCLDGNNTNIFERPAQAHEFILWSICPSASSDPEKNVWSGLHTRLSSEIIESQTVVDGLVVWDWICGTVARPCPKLSAGSARANIGPYKLVPPCIYLFPDTVPSVRNNPAPQPQAMREDSLLGILHSVFKGSTKEINAVSFEVEYRGSDLARRTSIERNGQQMRKSAFTPIRRK